MMPLVFFVSPTDPRMLRTIDAIMRARSLKREAFPDDVEGTVVFLASDDSAFMSGQTLIVDGGSVFSTL